MSIPIKTIEEVKSKNTTNRAYLFIDASDNILKMKINDKFYSFSLTGNGNLEPDNPPLTPDEPSIEIDGVDVAQSVLGVVFEIGATAGIANDDIMELFVKENETDYVCLENNDIKIIYYQPDCEDVYEYGPDPIELSNRYVLKNVATGDIYAISRQSNDILNFSADMELAPGFEGGSGGTRPIYKNYEIKWDGDPNNIVVGKYTYIEEENKWIKINENNELNYSLYLKLYNYLSNNHSYAFIVVYNNDDPMYASFSNPDYPGEVYDDDWNVIAVYPPMDFTNKDGIKMNGLGYGYNNDDEGLFTYSERFGINVESFSGDMETVDCPSLWFENIDAYYKKSESEQGSKPDAEPETPNYGEGALRVSGFTDLNNEMMGLSYPFSNFNGIYRKNSDASYEKIYDLNDNPVSTPYFILMDTNNGYWCLCETSTISHYHSSLAYHDGDDGVMPPTAENGITWFYSGQYGADLNNFTIEEI